MLICTSTKICSPHLVQSIPETYIQYFEKFTE